MARPAASEYSRTASYAIAPSEHTTLERVLEPQVRAHPGQSGFYLINQGKDALLLRIGMINAAEKSIDIQYYSIQNDVTGKLILEAILRAAARGVRVRMLVDDMALKKSDPTWALLNSHSHIEMRIFNPFATRDQGLLGRAVNLLTDFERITKRMHHKVFIADNQLSIVGGRNLGDAYFDNSEEFNFRDVDILSAGPITARISRNFDSFWNGKEAFPVNVVHPTRPQPGDLGVLRRALQAHWEEQVEKGVLANLTTVTNRLQDGQWPLLWANAELAADSPAKIDQPPELADSKPASRLEMLAAQAQHEFIIVSPYFVPGDGGVRWLKSLEDRGVRVRLMTNSLASTDVVAVHTGYRRYREDVLKAGIELYEMKPLPGRYPRSGRFASSSRASLHTKIYVIDRSDILVGTFNLDPRSIELNTEIALVIHSPVLAQQVVQMFEQAISPASSYRLALEPQLEWVAEENGKEVHYHFEPKAGLWRNVSASMYGLLPFEDQL